MASWTDTRLQDPAYKRYILSVLSIEWLHVQLVPYLQHVICDIHSRLLRAGHSKPQCHSHSDSYKSVKACLRLSCGTSLRLLDKLHARGSVQQSWKNSNIELWEDQPWTLAMLYMDQVNNPYNNKLKSPAECDIPDLINLMKSCTKFQVKNNLLDQIQEKRNKLFHQVGNLHVTARELHDLLKVIELLLTDAEVTYHVTGDVTNYTEKVRQMGLEITFQDEIKVLRETIKYLEEKKKNDVFQFIVMHEDLYKIFKADIQQNDNQGPGSGPPSAKRISSAISVKEVTVKFLVDQLAKCYLHRPEFSTFHPLVDSAAGNYLIESIFVEVELDPGDTKPENGPDIAKMKNNSKLIRKASDLVPPGHGERYVLHIFPGKGQTKSELGHGLCLNWVRQWSFNIKHLTEQTRTISDSPLFKYDLVLIVRAQTIHSNIYQTIKDFFFGTDDAVTTEDLEALLSTNSSTLLIVDGYEEADSEQKRIIDNVISYNTMTKSSVIITTRSGAVNLSVDKTFCNLDFNKRQQLKFIEKFKKLVNPSNMSIFLKFEHRFKEHKHASELLTSPMMAMSTSTMAANGKHVSLGSRISMYVQLNTFLIERVCTKTGTHFTRETINKLIPAFNRAIYDAVVFQNEYHLCREDLLNYLEAEQIDDILGHLGYVSVTRQVFGINVRSVYTVVHKGFAEFVSAKHIMGLDKKTRSAAVCSLFKSGPSNLEVLRFTLGLCSVEEPNHLLPLVKVIGNFLAGTGLLMIDTRVDTKIDSKIIKTESQKIKATHEWINEVTAYFLATLVDIDVRVLSKEVLRGLSRVCIAVRLADISMETLQHKMGALINISAKVHLSALSLYTGLLLAAHNAQNTLDNVQELDLWCQSDSPHGSVTCLPATLSACTPRMTALTRVDIYCLVSFTELGEVCRGLVASRVPCLTELRLVGAIFSDLHRTEGGHLSPVVRLIRAASQLTDLELRWIHAGSAEHFQSLCSALEERAPRLMSLRMEYCCVPAQQYQTMLLPALRARLDQSRARLGKVWLKWEWGENNTQEEREVLEAGLREVALKVKFS